MKQSIHAIRWGFIYFSHSKWTILPLSGNRSFFSLNSLYPLLLLIVFVSVEVILWWRCYSSLLLIPLVVGWVKICPVVCIIWSRFSGASSRTCKRSSTIDLGYISYLRRIETLKLQLLNWQNEWSFELRFPLRRKISLLLLILCRIFSRLLEQFIRWTFSRTHVIILINVTCKCTASIYSICYISIFIICTILLTIWINASFNYFLLPLSH